MKIIEVSAHNRYAYKWDRLGFHSKPITLTSIILENAVALPRVASGCTCGIWWEQKHR